MRSPEDFPADIIAKAREIVQSGGGILLPFDAGDAQVDFSSRWKLRDTIARALMERDRAATERAAKAANELAETLRNQCNKSFNHGDQGSAILERTKADALDEFAAAIRSQL